MKVHLEARVPRYLEFGLFVNLWFDEETSHQGYCGRKKLLRRCYFHQWNWMN